MESTPDYKAIAEELLLHKDDPIDFDEMAAIAVEKWRQDRPQAIAVDTETTGFTWTDSAFCVTVAWEGEDHYIELGDFVREISIAEMLDGTPTLIFHNAKFDMRMLINANLITRESLTPDRIQDTEALSHLLDENRRKKLKMLMNSELGIMTDEDEVLKVVRRKLGLKIDDGYFPIPRNVLIPYAKMDARGTFDLHERFVPQIREYQELVALYQTEMELCLVLLDMESKGMAVEQSYVDAQVKEYGRQILEKKLSIAKYVGNEDFNPNSPKQVLPLIRSLGFNVDSTSADVLKGLDHPVISTLMELKKLEKIRGTYLIPMQKEVTNGILHPSMRQHGTKTGRMSSGAEEG